MALTRITKGVIKPNENYDTNNINSTGIITAVSANFSGNVTIGGTLTYEDVTSVDVVGVMTATGADINGDLDVDGHTNLDNVSIAGVSTFSGDVKIDAGTSTTLTVEADSAGVAMVKATGGSGAQATAAFELVQSTTSVQGGGISYNGDGSPAFVSGETQDATTFYRIQSGSRYEVFSYPYNLNTVTFNGDLYGQRFHGPVTGNLTGTVVTAAQGNITSLGTLTALSVSGTTSPINFTHTGGDCVRFKRNGKTLSINANYAGNDAYSNIVMTSGMDIRWSLGGADRINFKSAGHIEPVTDSQINLGSNTKRFANVYADTLYGGLPITNGSDNRVITASSASAIQGEANLTYDGSKLMLAANSTAYDAFQVGNGLFIGNTTDNLSAAIFHQGGGADLEVGAQDMITFTTGSTAGNATERLRISSTGEVRVNGDGSGTGYLRIQKDRDTAYSSSGGNAQDLIIQQISDSTNTGGHSALALQCNYTGQTGAWVAINAVRTGVGAADLTINPRNNSTGDVERVRITSAGKIGIGTDNPKQWVSMNSGRVSVDIKADYYGAWIDGDSSGTSSFNVGRWHNAGGRMRSGGSHDNDLVVETQNTSHNLQLQPSGGKVGIGEDNPSSILHVSGSSTPTILNKPTDATPALFVGDSNRTGAGQHLAEYRGNWDGTLVGRIIFAAGDDTANKDDGHIYFHTTPSGGSSSERLRIDSSGRLLIANISSRAIANVTAKVQLEGTSADGSAISITRNSASANPPYLNFGKSRATSAGGTTIIQDGDNLGEIRFSGADGNDLTNHAASINAEVDGTPGNNVTPGRLIFSTATGSDAVERVRINSSGQVGIGTDLSGAGGKFQVFGTNTVLARFGNTIGATYEAISIKNTVAGYPAVCNDSSSDTLDLRSMGSVQVTIDSNNNSTGKYFRVMHNGEGNSGTELFRIDDDGNVGINENSPAFRLHVNGTGRFESDLSINSGSKIWTNNSQGQLTIMGGATYPGGAIKFAGGQSGATDQGTIKFYAGTATSLQERLRIGSTGETILVRLNTFPNPNNTGSEILGGKLVFGSNISLEERYPNGAYVDRQDLVLRTNTGYGQGLSDKIRFTSGGNIKFQASGQGIDFSATEGSGHTGDSVFDDYEVGTWTPAVTGLTGLIDAQGRYIKVGDQVTAAWYFNIGNKTYASGYGSTQAFIVTGLPYTCDHGNSGPWYGAHIGNFQYCDNLGGDNGGNSQLMMNIGDNYNSVHGRRGRFGNNAFSNMQLGDFYNNFSMHASITYRTA